MAQLLHSGSVKDIYSYSDNELLFRFSDRYSIFDWGTMPDLIQGKGEALAKMGAFFFEELQALGYKTHYLGKGPSSKDLRVTRVFVPKNNPELYETKPVNTLIPLEVIFRLGVPKGSSLIRRLTNDESWVQAGYSRRYSEDEFFDRMHLDYTTKLEPLDRPLSHEEARKLACMSDSEWAKLEQTTQGIAEYLKNRFASLDLTLWDGKFEFAFGPNREIVLVDSIGIDELRLTYQNKPYSKEILRQHYITSDWYRDLVKAKALDSVNFRALCREQYRSEPVPLSPEKQKAISMLYVCLAELLVHPEKKATLQLEISSAFQALGGSP